MSESNSKPLWRWRGQVAPAATLEEAAIHFQKLVDTRPVREIVNPAEVIPIVTGTSGDYCSHGQKIVDACDQCGRA
jgi:hypothetical protein